MIVAAAHKTEAACSEVLLDPLKLWFCRQRLNISVLLHAPVSINCGCQFSRELLQRARQQVSGQNGFELVRFFFQDGILHSPAPKVFSEIVAPTSAATTKSWSETTSGTSLVVAPPLWDHLFDGVRNRPRNIPKPWASLREAFRDHSASQEFNIHPWRRTAQPFYKPSLGHSSLRIFAPSRPRITPERSARPQTSISGPLGRPGALTKIRIIRTLY